MALDGSLDLLRIMLDGVDIWGLAPMGRGSRPEEEDVTDEEFAAFREALEAVIGTLAPNQMRHLSALMVAHASFLAGALLTMPAPEEE